MEQRVSKLVIYGTRPEEIKLYPFTKYDGYSFLEVNQSQDLHQGLIRPGYKCEEHELKSFIKILKPKIVIVQGDTRTAFYGALYAFELGIPVAHIEAGLRTFDLSQPFPEEGYRQMIDCIATYKFCSTKEAVDNCNGVYVGQTSIDTLFEFIPEITDKGYTIVTLHRNESFKRLPELMEYIKTIDNPLIIAHPNKVGRALAKEFDTYEAFNYKEFVKLLAECHSIVTDSGGLQEEAMALGKPFTILREKRERGYSDKYVVGASEKIHKYLCEV
jgi:UDP-N-acetylglucosamine 2-epimerase (non-hydrolysing)